MTETVHSDSFFGMGTRCDLVLIDVDEQKAQQIFQIIKNEILHLENIMNRFDPNSSISRLNRSKAGVWLETPDELWDILLLCYDFYQMSNGAFDVTSWPLIDLWKNNAYPTNSQIESCQQFCGFDKVEFDTERQRLRFKEEGMQFDLGAIGKGIALDRVKSILQKQGKLNGIVSFGESSVLALGVHPSGNYWPIGIQNVMEADDFIHVFEVSDAFVTSSGTLKRSDEGQVVKRNHVISPASGELIQEDRTVSVKSNSATLGEFVSTTWLILSEHDRSIMVESLKEMEILEVNYSDADYSTKLTIAES